MDTEEEARAHQANVLRQEGNALFQRREFHDARTKYSHALSLHPLNPFLYGNRSAAHHRLQAFDRALEDAQKAIELAPDWSKGYLRHAAACEALGRWTDALASYETFVRLARDRACPDVHKVQTKVRILQRKAGRHGGLAVRRGFFSDDQSRPLYDEKDEEDPWDDKPWQRMLQTLLDGCNPRGVNRRGENVVLAHGVFATLLDPDAFQRLVYPGIPTEQLVQAPTSLQALLADPWYAHELVALMPRVQEKAARVLQNVKRRGAQEGEQMDATTERRLLPQVLHEAFAREVLAIVHRVNYHKHVQLANDERLLADPNADVATWDQLDETCLNALLRERNGRGFVAVRDAFMGEEWTHLLLSDVVRMATNGLLLTASLQYNDAKQLVCQQSVRNQIETGSGAKMRFVERQDCTEAYPALSELIEKLHALPYEMNRKRPEHAKLCAPFVHCTAVHQLPAGRCQPLRLDCGTGDKDNGVKLTCIYFFNRVDGEQTSSTRLNLRTDLRDDASVRQIEPKPDRLVLFHSPSVFNEITAVSNGTDLFYLTFWIHGQTLG
ncbi:hypothetical protein PsorP6_009734 [Peronosclerospora sorghi]|uniref:Uncharacterized protein n=1 Tax=Peronosclerospora sorghi TaxID=230839 RepID=A0ACC0W037_9STRA|nr:hypothetical protein PsorP6_009734 [Peronosclerospora sorghi]